MVPESRTFAADPASVAEARRFVRQTLAGWQADHFEDRAVHVLSELATNSVIHARSGFVVELSLDPAGLRLCVSDDSARRPVRKSRSAQATTGRGIALVEALSAAWGVDRNGSGKTVWVLLTAQPDEGREPTGRSVPLELFAPPDDIDADPDEGVWACLTRPAA
jgi:anti-sigma regulatory factor (Ser/Thr protein kinase)